MDITNGDHEYLLEIKSRDYNQQLTTAKGPTIIKQVVREYHRSLKDALDSLLLRDIQAFESGSNIARQENIFTDHITISRTATGNAILQLDKNSISDAIEGGLPAGLYFKVPGSIADIEHLTGYNFSAFENYDPASNMLLLARYIYDKVFTIQTEPAYDELAGNRQRNEDIRFYEEEWHYKIQLEKIFFNQPDIKESISYYYCGLDTAFADLLKLDLRKLDKDLGGETPADTWITKACIQTRNGYELVELIAVRSDQHPDRVSEPGIHLKFFIDIPLFEQRSHANLSHLGNYGQDDQYLLLAHYTRDYQSLLPLEGYERLLALPAGAARQDTTTSSEHFTLVTEWDTRSESLKELTGSDHINSELPGYSLEEACRWLLNLPEYLFFKDQAEAAGKALLIRAGVFENGKEIMCKFPVEDSHEDLPPGVYIKINQDYLSIELLKLLKPNGQSIEQTSELHFVIPPSNKLSDKPVDKKQSLSSKNIFPFKKEKGKAI